MRRRFADRALVAVLMIWPAALQAATTSETPGDVVAAVYAHDIAESKKPSPGTAFTSRSIRARYFSKGFDRLITRSEARSAKEQEPGPVDFDPVISGQDGEIRSLTVETDQASADKAVASAHFSSFGHPVVVTYDFVKETRGWRIDDIRGKAGKAPWSIRRILEDAEHRK